jgi:RNA polymerase sigma-70 factor, ECF subfamily
MAAHLPVSTDRGSSRFLRRTETDLEGLITSAKAGSDSALGRALNACRPPLLRAAARAISPALRPLVGASDVVQDTFVNATKAIRGFRGRGAPEFLGWLRVILFNRLAEITRRNAWQRTIVRLRLNGEVEHSRDWIHIAAASPSGVFQAEEFGAMIEMALARLPERDRQLLALRFAEGMSFPQIGERLGLSEFVARTSFHLALEHIRRELRTMDP